MFGSMFVACFVASIGKILWPVDKGCSGMVLGQKLACTGAVKELSSTSVRGSHACNTPKYTLAVFDMFRVFCKPNLNVS